MKARPPPLFDPRSSLSTENWPFLESLDLLVSFVSWIAASMMSLSTIKLTISSILLFMPLQLNCRIFIAAGWWTTKVFPWLLTRLVLLTSWLTVWFGGVGARVQQEATYCGDQSRWDVRLVHFLMWHQLWQMLHWTEVMLFLSTRLHTEQRQVVLLGPGFNSIPAIWRSSWSNDAGNGRSLDEKTETIGDCRGLFGLWPTWCRVSLGRRPIQTERQIFFVDTICFLVFFFNLVATRFINWFWIDVLCRDRDQLLLLRNVTDSFADMVVDQWSYSWQFRTCAQIFNHKGRIPMEFRENLLNGEICDLWEFRTHV